MTRGNQRELARQKAMKKQAEQKKGRDLPEGVSFKTVMEQEAEIMRQKQQKALEKKRLEEEERLAALRASKAK